MKLEVGISSSKFSALTMWQDSDNTTHTLQVFTLKLWTTRYHSSNRSCCGQQNDKSRLTHYHKVTHLFPLSLVKNLLITLTIFRACLVLLHNNNVIKFNLFTAFPWTKLFHYILFRFLHPFLQLPRLKILWFYMSKQNVPISGEKSDRQRANYFYLTWTGFFSHDIVYSIQSNNKISKMFYCVRQNYYIALQYSM